MPVNRRRFIHQTTLAVGALLASPLARAKAEEEEAVERITVLHTNDTHSRLDPFPDDGGRNAGLGGVAARAETIRQIRAEAENVLLLDAGDIFQGTPYFNLYKGEPEIKAMSLMQYDAATIGNHDFDGGIDNLAHQLQHASFPMVNCNYDFNGTPMEAKAAPYKVFQKGNIKVGLLGVGIELRGLVPENLSGKTIYHDPVVKANETAEILKQKHKCNMIICLSHLGDKYNDNKISDEILAKETFDIDLIIGGHTHRFFKAPRKYKNRNSRDVVVNQVGFAGINLGRLDYIFHRTGKKNLLQSHSVVIARKTSG